jgi:hypothetical protein
MFRYCLIIVLLTISVAFGQDCKFTDQNGISYDLSSLRKQGDYQVQDPITSSSSLFGISYLFNICDSVKSTCAGNAVFEVLSVMGTLTETCEVVGRPDNKKVTSVTQPDGSSYLEIIYPGGDICIGSENPTENGQPKKAQFQIACNPRVYETEFTYAHIDGKTVTRCSPLFKITNGAGCKPGYLASSSNSFFGMLFWLIIIGIVYLGVGIAYNMHKFGSSGIDAIPHLEFWKNVPEIVTTGARKSYDAVLDATDKIKGNLSGVSAPKPSNTQYTTV